MSDTALVQKILDHYDDLPKSERRLADVLIESPDFLVEHSATDLAQKSNVSKATTVRFFKRIGFNSSREARELTRQSIGQKVDPRLPRQSKSQPSITLNPTAFLQIDQQNLFKTFEQLDYGELEKALEILGVCDKLWIVGFEHNYPLAHMARALLIRVRPDVRMIPLVGFSVPEELASLTERDAVLVFGVGKLLKRTKAVLRSSRNANSQVVFITDQFGVLGSELATVTLRSRTKSAGGLFDSFAAPMSLVTYLCTTLATLLGSDALDRLGKIESIYSEWDDLRTSDL